MARPKFTWTVALKPLTASAAIALALALQPAKAECDTAQQIEEPFVVRSELGYLPFALGSSVGEEDESTAVAEGTPPEQEAPVEPILMAGGFDFD